MTIPIAPPVRKDPEYCESPTGDHKHSESWYDCKPCEFCGDDSKPDVCDCDRPSHAPGAQQATVQTVIIDVYDDENLVTEATVAGCVATLYRETRHRYEYKVVGPEDLLVPLLASWGYDEGCYEIIDPVKAQQQEIEAAHYIGEPQ